MNKDIKNYHGFHNSSTFCIYSGKGLKQTVGKETEKADNEQIL